MKKDIHHRLIFAVCFSSLLISCAPKNNNIDFDFSKLKRPKKITTIDKVKKVNDDFENDSYLQDLIPLKNKQEILSNTKFGKKDPFSKGDLKANNLYLDLKLTGFLNTEIKKFAIVTYLDNQGTLIEESVGGLNTNLLPNGAKVIKIDSKNKKLIISFENEKFIFEL
tara:strand:- start:556 stop:1056 length:501 start_codon:yes stop_codon:yes gene_type:complete